MQSQTIQWFPGHMAKTRRLITENLGNVDVVIELLDARIPNSSKNPEIQRLTAGKPTLTLLNKCSLADPAATAKWTAAYGGTALPIDCVTGEGLKQIYPAVRRLLADKLKRYEERGMSGRKLRAMTVGIPNVGKSSLVNRLSGGKKARVEDRPGVTMSKQWITTTAGIDLLDMPGVLWPKFDDQRTGENLAITGAIRDAVIDLEELAGVLCRRLLDVAPAAFIARYRLNNEGERLFALKPHELLGEVARKRGFLVSGGEPDTERAAVMLLDEFRGAKIGRITLELPGEPKRKISETASSVSTDKGVSTDGDATSGEKTEGGYAGRDL